MKLLIGIISGLVVFAANCFGQATRLAVAVHDSEYTRNLANLPASAPTPTGSGTTGFQWWVTDWAYFVMPESVKEMLRSDGTPYAVLGDSNILAGNLLTNGQPAYPILISLASEAIRDEQIAQLTNYVAAGGFLFVGSSSFTRYTNGQTRGDFAIGSQMGIHMVRPGLTNWTSNNYMTKALEHRLTAHLPAGQLTWRMPSNSEEIFWGISPSHPFLAPHDSWLINVSNAVVLANGETGPMLAVRQYGKGYFIYFSQMQPVIGHGGFAPTYYSYLIFRRAIEWAFETFTLPIPKLSPWPYQYDAAFMVRHDLENDTNLVANIEASARFEFTNGAFGDYYFCTGTVREDAPNPSTIIAGLRRAMTNYGATIGPHNGGLKNPNNPGLSRGQYDYWHWGPDEALDVTPAGYTSGKAYAFNSISNSFRDIEGWLPGLMTNGMRTWVACYFNATREDSFDIQDRLNVKISGEQKIGPFPHWTISTRTPNKRYRMLSQPPSDWFIGGLVAQSLEPWHYPGVFDTASLRQAIEAYYSLGGLINFYSHTLSTGEGPAGSLASEYVLYGMNTNLHPRLWSANAIGIYDWWMQRSNVQVTATFSTNGGQYQANLSIRGAVSANTAIELLIPGTNLCGVQVTTNGVLAGGSVFRVSGGTVKVRVGSAITNAVVNYSFLMPGGLVYSENYDSVSPPALPSGWTSAATGAQSPWVTQNTGTNTPPNEVFVPSPGAIGVSDLTTAAIPLTTNQAVLSFRHRFNLEPGSAPYDGGVLEIKTGSGNFTDIVAAGGSFTSNGYSGTISSAYGNPLAGRSAWWGDSGGYLTTSVLLPPSALGQNVQFRWRCGTDNSTSSLGWWLDSISITASYCQCCPSGNNAPILPALPDVAVAEGSLLSVTNTAMDFESPPGALVYQLLAAPPGAQIDGNGIITWTPTESQGPGTNTIRTKVTDSGSPPLSATNTFTVIVTEVNSAPTLTVQTNRAWLELTTLTITNSATDEDIPANGLSYSLLSPPSGATINSSGVITWTPSETLGPGTNTITSVVTDNGVPPQSATNVFTVIVTEVNQGPVLPTVADRLIVEQTQLVVTNSASDADLPPNGLFYSLLSAPAGMQINEAGVVTWTPSESQGGTTNLVQTRVTDNGAPVLSATNSFKVVVIETNSAPILGPVSDRTITESTTLAVTNTAVDNDLPANTVTYILLHGPSGAVIDTNGVITWTPTEAQGPGTNVIATVVTDNGEPALSVTNSFTVVVLETNSAPALGVITNQTLVELTTMVVTHLATDGDLPVNHLTYALVNGPVGAVIEANGVITWTPTEAQGPGTNLIETVVTDNGEPALSVTNSFTVVVLETNSAPALGVITNQTLVELTTMVVANLATDGDLPVNHLTYELVNGPVGAVIDTNGVITWAPTEAQGPGTNVIETVVTDNGEPALSVTNSFTVVVIETNSAPVLGVVPDQTVGRFTMLVVTNMATDSDLPANTLSYALVNAPDEAVIDTNGVITWTPTEAQGPGTNLFEVVATDNGVPALSATNRFAVVVLETNSAPVLGVITNQTLVELMTMVVTNSATDSDFLANALSYALVNAPDGAVIDTNGVITWTPTEEQGPGTNVIETLVTDNGVPALSATNSFTVVVMEANSAPIPGLVPDQTITELTTLAVTNTAADDDLPANTLSYVLVKGPAGAVIDTNGVIAWAPGEGQGPGTNVFEMVVTDNGVPALSATNSFTVVVMEANTAPMLGLVSDQTITELTTLTVTNTAADNDLPANTLSYVLVKGPSGAVIDTSGVITWTPMEGQGPGTNVFEMVVTDDGNPALSATNSFTVVVMEANTAPMLDLVSDQTIAELTTLTVTNTAADNDLPANTLTYVLVNAPSGAVIDTKGVITWTPTEAQGPGTNVIETVATDNGVPVLSTTNSFTVVVTEVNTSPVLPAQINRTNPPMVTMMVTNTAFDIDVPAETLSYSLQGPGGAVISPTGVITWTPAQTDYGTTNLFQTTVTDNGQPPLSATNVFTVVVNTDAIVVLEQVTLAQEQCVPANHRIDPGEAVVVQFSFKNVGYGNTTNLTVSLLETNGVIQPGPAGYLGVLVGNGASATQAFAFAATGHCGGTVIAHLQLQDGPKDLGRVAASFDLGTPGTVMTQDFDSVVVPALPSGWTSSSSGALSAWVTQNTVRDTLPNAAFTPNASAVGENQLISPAFLAPVGPVQLAFRHSYNMEAAPSSSGPGYDGGVLEIKLGTNEFMDIIAAGGSFAEGAYNRTISANYGNVLSNRLAWSGNSVGFTNTVISLPTSAAGQVAQLRWRCATDKAVTSNAGWHVDSIILTGMICCENTPPVLTAIPDQTIPEMTPLVVTNTATDSSTPAYGLTYLLLDAPAGAIIDAQGIISWIPTEAQGPGTNLFTTVVTDSAVPSASATNSFRVVVTEVNSAPVLSEIPYQMVAELTTLTFTNTAVDSDVPVETLNYALIDAPAGAVIDTNGVITWTPTEADGPATTVFTTVVTDSGSPTLAATNSFTVLVAEVNLPPVLPGQTNYFLVGAAPLSVVNSASDPDLPQNGLGYLLAAGPANASVSAEGIISWTPTPEQIPSTNYFTIVVTDTNNYATNDNHLSATNSFTVFVSSQAEAEIPLFKFISVTNGVSSLAWTTIPGRTYRLQFKGAPEDLVWTDITPDFIASSTMIYTTNAIGSSMKGFYRVILLP